MFDRDPLAVVMAVMPRMRDPAMQGLAAYNFLRAGPMARAHLVSNGRLRLRGLILRRCDGSRRGRFLSEGRRAQAESGDGGERQHNQLHQGRLTDPREIGILSFRPGLRWEPHAVRSATCCTCPFCLRSRERIWFT